MTHLLHQLHHFTAGPDGGIAVAAGLIILAVLWVPGLFRRS